MSSSSATSATLAVPRRRRRMRQPDRLTSPWLTRGILLVAGLFTGVPLLYLLLLSVSSENDVAAGNLVPRELVPSNYVEIWSAVPLLRGFANSALICGAAAGLCVIVATAAAYPIVRHRFRGGKVMLQSALIFQLVPHSMFLLPMYAIFAALQVYLGLTVIGTYWGIIIAYITFALPFALWLMVSYLSTVPKEFEEAAWVDGAGTLQTLRHVVIPLATPGMVVTFVFALLMAWNDVMFASVLTTPDTQTIAIALRIFTVSVLGAALPQYALLMAAGVVASIPVVLAYLFLQKYLITGLASGGVK